MTIRCDAAGREIGLDSVEDVIHLLTGETAVAIWFDGGDRTGQKARSSPR